MIIVFQFILAFLICTMVPLLIGDLLLPQEAFGKQYIMGIFCTLAVSQVLFLPFVLCQHHFTPYYYVYVAIIGGLCILSIVKRHGQYLEKIRLFLDIKGNIGDFNLWMFCAILLIGMQVARAAFGHFFVYADNAHYIPVVNDLLESDMDSYLDSITAVPGAKETDVKYLFTTYFPYLASICKFSGLHVAILAQTLLPIILTITLYNLVWHYGLFLFRDKRTTWMFVMFFSVLVETIGGYDFTFANHAISGIYFGKKIVFTLLLPYMMLFIAEKTLLLEDSVKLLKRNEVFLLFIMMIGVCAPSLMGTGLAPIVIFVLGIVLSIRKKTLIPIAQLGISMIPSIVYLLMVVMHMYF